MWTEEGKIFAKVRGKKRLIRNSEDLVTKLTSPTAATSTAREDSKPHTATSMVSSSKATSILIFQI